MNNFLHNPHKRLFFILGFLLIAIAIPLTVFIAQKQQDIRQRASASDVSFSLPGNNSVPLNQTISVGITLSAGGNNIQSIDFTMTFDKDILEYIDFQPTATFSEVKKTTVSNANQSGTFNYIGASLGTSPNTGSNIFIGSIIFRGKSLGSATVAFQTATVTAISASNQAITLQTNNNSGGTYTVTPDTPSITPIPSTTGNPSPTETSPTTTSIPTIHPTAAPTIVTSCPLPTAPTPAANTVQFTFTVNLPSIGTQGNTGPKHCSRDIAIQIFNSNNQQQGQDIQGTIDYNPSSQNFKGYINAGNLEAGQYYLIIALPQHIRKLIPGFQTVSGPGNVNVTVSNLVVGNVNIQGDSANAVDAQDYNTIISCYGNRAGSSSCPGQTSAATDLDDDGIVGPIDLNIFLRSRSSIRGD
ncbi:MAG: hypothetical protein A2770_02800 [Candidatus Levybacteria bacterium RIFCSPHIGHO2_01_FULL_38_12]|nr:MAG: hypothetical protein A2770_02800 [Candidatus Levybacteria bacterium RIFCSPHIGHO2_01_FULL_38_12]